MFASSEGEGGLLADDLVEALEIIIGPACPDYVVTTAVGRRSAHRSASMWSPATVAGAGHRWGVSCLNAAVKVAAWRAMCAASVR